MSALTDEVDRLGVNVARAVAELLATRERLESANAEIGHFRIGVAELEREILAQRRVAIAEGPETAAVRAMRHEHNEAIQERDVARNGSFDAIQALLREGIERDAARAEAAELRARIVELEKTIGALRADLDEARREAAYDPWPDTTPRVEANCSSKPNSSPLDRSCPTLIAGTSPWGERRITMTLRAYHGDPAIKARYLARVRAHRMADKLIQGTGWAYGKGCAVGCTLESYEHGRYPIELGIPLQLAHLEDRLFELLPHGAAMSWPERFLSAISVGANLGDVWPAWAAWMLLDPQHGVINYVGDNVDVRSAVEQVGLLYRQGTPSASAACASSASSAAWAARAAAAADIDTWVSAACGKLLELLAAAPVGKGCES